MRIPKIPFYLAFVIVIVVAYANITQVRASEGDDNSVSASSDTFQQIDGLVWLQHTENKYICMVNNKRFDRVQIPTEVNGKTYYGCCSMCKAKLEKIASMRVANDPVSDNVVDKATALIGTSPDGTAYYFENENNMRAFDKINLPQ